jgi:hypothetical protein
VPDEAGAATGAGGSAAQKQTATCAQTTATATAIMRGSLVPEGAAVLEVIREWRMETNCQCLLRENWMSAPAFKNFQQADH